MVVFGVAGWVELCKGGQRRAGKMKRRRREKRRTGAQRDGVVMAWLGLALGQLKTNRLAGSIREFCSLQTPIIMFDKNSDYVVMTIEQVSPFFLPCSSDRHCALFFSLCFRFTTDTYEYMHISRRGTKLSSRLPVKHTAHSAPNTIHWLTCFLPCSFSPCRSAQRLSRLLAPRDID